jgi:hypothetical protein
MKTVKTNLQLLSKPFDLASQAVAEAAYYNHLTKRTVTITITPQAISSTSEPLLKDIAGCKESVSVIKAALFHWFLLEDASIDQIRSSRKLKLSINKIKRTMEKSHKLSNTPSEFGYDPDWLVENALGFSHTNRAVLRDLIRVVYTYHEMQLPRKTQYLVTKEMFINPLEEK